jgi:transposase
MVADVGNPEARAAFFRLVNDGESNDAIARAAGLSVRTVQRWRLKLHRDGKLAREEGSGRPRALDERDIRQLRRAVAQNPRTTLDCIREQSDLNVSCGTIRRYLMELGVHSLYAFVRQDLTAGRALMRLEWARRHQNLQAADFDFWAFSDECAVHLVDPNRRTRLWITVEQRLQPSLVQRRVHSGGGHVMIWGVITAHGVGPLVFIEGTLDGAKYRDMARDVIIPHLFGLMARFGRPFVFVDDNAPAHNARIVNEVFENSGAHRIFWPPYSPDMNPIENIWAYIKHRLHALPRRPANLAELKARIQTIWDSISVEMCRNHLRSMPRRLESLVAADGWYF